MVKILQLDINGQPKEWITWQDAAVYHAKGLVSWSLGEYERVIRGGNNRITGEQSIIKTSSIIAVKGAIGKRHSRIPALNNTELFRRDRCMCAYCGNVFSESKLTRDHIVPRALKGQDIWMNVVTCCAKCNQKKDCKTLDEAGMTLLYAPYIPSMAEHLILQNRNILADQMEFLMGFVDAKSRLHQEIKMH